MYEMQNDNIPVIDQEMQEYERIAIRRLIRKLDWLIMPIIFLLETGSYINRSSFGHAQLMGIRTDLHASESQINWAVAIFFLAFLIFAIPSTILMRYLRPRRYLSLSMFSWGALTIGMAFVQTPSAIIAVRFLLGMAQAGFFPSMVIYISLWYRKKDHTMRIAILFSAAILSSALGSILAYGFRHMDGVQNLNSWQWMFLLEGIPMIPLAFLAFFLLNDTPSRTQCLNPAQNTILTNILRNDEGVHTNETGKFSWRQAFYVFIDWKIYFFALINIVISGMIKYLTTYLPLLVEDMLSSGAKVHLMTAPPYAFAFICCLLVNYSSSRFNEHGLHLVFCLSLALLGFILMIALVNHGNTVLYISCTIACCGVLTAFPLLLSWITKNIDGRSKRTIAIGFVIGIGQLFGIILPLVYHDDSTNQRMNCICLGIVAAGLVLTIILRFCLWIENRQRDHLSAEEKERKAAIKQPCDWHPDVRYIL